MKKLFILIVLIIFFSYAISAESSVNNSLNSSNDSLNLTIQNNSEENSSITGVEENSQSASSSSASSSSSGSSSGIDENYGEIPEDLYYCPQSDGYVGEIADEYIHDSGQSGGGDALEVYCRNNIIRLCLSEEPCPWRNSISSNDEITCSGNYGSSPMAFSANEKGINIAELIDTGSQRIENIYCNGESWSVEFSGTNENNNQGYPSENSNQNICSGCEFQGDCIPFGYRLKDENNKNVYCEISKGLELQKEQNISCQNNFECSSNQCVEGTCINLQKTLEETNNTLQKIIDFLKKLFGFE